MRKINLVVLLGCALTITACGNRNDTAMDNDATDAPLGYLAYVQKMIATGSDDSEPWDVETVQVEQSDDSEAIDVM